MDFLLLWSGDVRGMRKAQIPSTPCKGYLHRIDENGAAVVPDREAIEAVLPVRLRPAFRRSQQCQINNDEPMRGQRQAPLMFDLCRQNGTWITRLYLQPLDAAFADQQAAS
ncbi:hypothetical protein [Roseobacter weihaiensis]|uniref:hypothetical protein n=1 Tax=Roseobacter weihaiensis TaxID=2763262 RepID=UPI001D0A743B|nr:hypothetical protein [Roseobacter sp. H9]